MFDLHGGIFQQLLLLAQETVPTEVQLRAMCLKRLDEAA